MNQPLSYRPDIDTLRTIAVLPVIIFHFNKHWLPGGFLGVDVFFVISGFLITLIMIKEMKAGVFSFKQFYIRRIKRILPVFFVVLTFVVIFSAFIFSPDAYSSLSKTAIASILFSANLYLSVAQGYFDPAQEEKPLLHTWSLSVEEQYYFIFPLLLLLLINKNWRIQIGLFALFIAISLFFSFFSNFGLDKYYLPHLRAFEMLIGSATAVYMQQHSSQGSLPGEKYAGLASLSALVVLCVCFFIYTPETSFFPGPAGIVPCLATAALLYFNSFNHSFKKIFQIKPFIYIGWISYSLYLWHWPVIVFSRYLREDKILPLNWAVYLFILIFCLSVLSYTFIEQPLRKKQWSFSKNIILFYIVPAAAVLSLIWILNQSRLIQQYHEQGLARSHTSCHNNLDKQCVWGDLTKNPRVMMLGDSHADHYKTFINHIGKKEGWSATLITADTCPYIENYDSDVYRYNRSCQVQHKYAKDNIGRYPIIMLAARWGAQIPQKKQSLAYDPDFFTKLENTLKNLSDKEAVYLFTDTPSIQYSGLQSYIRKNNLGMKATPLKADDATYLEGNRRIQEIASKYNNVYVIDTLSVLPDTFVYDDKPLYSDLDHLNPYGGKILAELYISKYVNLLGRVQ